MCDATSMEAVNSFIFILQHLHEYELFIGEKYIQEQIKDSLGYHVRVKSIVNFGKGVIF